MYWVIIAEKRGDSTSRIEFRLAVPSTERYLRLVKWVTATYPTHVVYFELI